MGRISGKAIMILIMAILFGYGLYQILNSRIKLHKVKQNYILVNGGVLLGLGKTAKSVGNYNVVFAYEFNDSIYKASVFKGLYFKNGSKIAISLRDHKFPVAVQKDNPGNANILITPDDFIFLNLNMPDSVKWVLELLKD